MWSLKTQFNLTSNRLLDSDEEGVNCFLQTRGDKSQYITNKQN